MMLNGGDHRFRDVIASALGWWADAGVDNLADDSTRDWLAAPALRMEIPAQPAPAPEASPAPPVSTALPDTLDALHALLSGGDYMPGAAPPSRRVGPAGTPGAELMIVTDMPDPGDGEAGHLFGAETARLFDAMLSAVGRDRAQIYYTPLSPARIAGRIDEKQGEALAKLMRHHIALARPKALILFGDETARWLLGPDALSERGGLRSVEHDGGSVPAIATFHPRHLRKMPALKAAAWEDMRRLLGVLGQ
jgi:DNA polymerase